MKDVSGAIRIMECVNDMQPFDIYYLTGVGTDSNGHITIFKTPNVWDATRFQWNTSDEELRKIRALVEFVKNCLPKKRFTIDFVPVVIEY